MFYNININPYKITDFAQRKKKQKKCTCYLRYLP